MEYISKSEKKTYQIASNIAKALRGGDVLALSGELGSGKTTFTKGLANALSIKRNITSPTFVLQKIYPLPEIINGISSLVHIDAYRLGHSDAENIGLLEALNRSDNLTIIEWPERILSVLPPHTKWIRFEYVDESSRRISHDSLS